MQLTGFPIYIADVYRFISAYRGDKFLSGLRDPPDSMTNYL